LTNPSPDIGDQPDHIVRTENLERLFQLPSGDIHALRGVNFSVKKGEMVAIMGSSGSGKTTLLNLIGTLDKPTRGKIFIDDKDVTKMKGRQITHLRRNKIGFIFQSYNLIPVLSAYENVELPLVVAGTSRKERRRRAFELLDMVNLLDRARHQPDELSGGEQQRVAIARALANHPSIILADEPTGDLDTHTGEEVMKVLRAASRKEGTTVIVVTHDPNISRLTDRVFFMKDGRIIGERKGNRLIQFQDESGSDPYFTSMKSFNVPRPKIIERTQNDFSKIPPRGSMEYHPQPNREVEEDTEKTKKITRIVEWRGNRRMIRDSKGIICLKCGAYNFGEKVKSCRICGEEFTESKPISISLED
jgi:putative ABC transport system ATP-binding protein